MKIRKLLGGLTGLCFLCALLFIGGLVQAQQYELKSLSSTVLTGGTNNIAASTTATYNLPIGLTKYGDVAVQVKFKGIGASTANVTVSYKVGIDGSTWDDTARTWVIPANGTSTVSFVTNITADATGYLLLTTIQNAATNAITNVTVQYALKPKRTG